MQHRDWRLRVEDILEAIAKIRRYTEGMTFETFTSDEKTIDAVMRNITIIGEAARHIPSEVQQRYPNVPWNEMRDIRNVVVHEYFRVSISILWHTVKQNLPPVVPRLKAILERES